MQASVPPNESRRLAALRAHGILDTPPEPVFDDLARLAAQLCGTPIAAMSLVDATRQWFKARIGLSLCETNRETAFCAHTILQPDHPLIVPDARLDPRFADNPLVTGAPHLRFYAGAPLVSSDGTILGALCVLDVEPRNLSAAQTDALIMLARQAMRQIEARQIAVHLIEQKAALDQHGSVAIADLEGRLTYVNDRLCALSGYTREELLDVNADLSRAAHPVHSFFRESWATVTAGATWRGEVQGNTKSGDALWTQATVVPMKNAEGRSWQYVAIGIDITPRKRNEEQLHLLVSALQQANEAIIITDADLNRPGPRIVFANAAFTKATGYSLAEVIGRSPRISQGPRTERAVLDRLRAALSRGDTFQGETVNYRKDGSTYEVEWQIAPVRTPAGHITHFVAVYRDISERRAFERQLERARDDALESVRLKSRFLANMSHELRTPLNTINGISATLVEQDLPAAAKDAVKLIHQCGENLLENIQTILTHSTLEAGKATLDTKPFSVAAVVLNALRVTSEAALRKSIEVGYDLDPRLPAEFSGDPFRLQQVLVNLIANAIKFTDSGRVHLRLRAAPLSQGRWELNFSVADTGIGIAPGNLGKLFKPFSQADDSTTRRFEGTGLGLAISKSIVDLMGGRITVASRPGVGSIFRVTLCLLAVAGAPPIFTVAGHPRLTGRRVLVVESDPGRRRQLVAMMKAWRINVTEARTAAAGISLATTGNFDLVLRRLPSPSAATTSPFAHFTSTQTLPVLWLVPPGPSLVATVPGRSGTLAGPFSPEDLSRALAALIGKESPPTAEAAPARNHQKLGERIPLRILSADDTYTNREMLTYICRHLGYQTDMVENGAQVLERLAERSYDLILLDIQMPVLAGISAAREICRRFPDPQQRPRVVAVTASTQPGDRERCLAAGMDAYLCKPILPKNLQACIELLFEGGIRSRPLSTAATPVGVNLPEAWVDADHLRATTQGLDANAATDLITQIYAASQADFASLRPRLIEACAARNSKQVALCVHGLKGCVLALGWSRMGSHCAETLHALRENRLHAWAELPAELDELYRTSAAEMERLLPQIFSSRAAA
ncbi:PAS domain S-box protein [Horticoccus sp. 23ND18S-11]|uniref:PAS domain S-box protein n=1 Tax=Horticoccus sp. 23ND18S-11 TaxID=3391832 RepID=UPI0039C8DA33